MDILNISTVAEEADLSTTEGSVQTRQRRREGTLQEFMLELVQFLLFKKGVTVTEQMYLAAGLASQGGVFNPPGFAGGVLDLFFNKYNINPAAGSRLGAKHTEETKELFSKINKKGNLNKTFRTRGGVQVVMKFWRVCVSVCLVL